MKSIIRVVCGVVGGSLLLLLCIGLLAVGYERVAGEIGASAETQESPPHQTATEVDQRATAAGDLEVHIADDATEDEHMLAAVAMAIVMEACPNFDLSDSYWDDITEANVTVHYADQNSLGHFKVEDFGWVTWVDIDLRVADNPARIPGRYRAAASVLFYSVGTGVQPGIHAMPERAIQVCGGIPESGFLATEHVDTPHHQ